VKNIFWKRRAGDSALSDIVGTMVLLGVTATLVSTSLVVINSRASPAPEAGQLHLISSGAPGGTNVSMLHAGGPTYDQGDLEYVIIINHTAATRGTFGPAGTPYGIGDRVYIPTPALVPGELLEISLVSTTHGATVAEANLDVPGFRGNVTAPVGFTINLDVTPDFIIAPATVVLEAHVYHPDGRKAIDRVIVDTSQINGPSALEMFDDGRGADAVAGDGIYTIEGIALAGRSTGFKDISATANDVAGAQVIDTSTVTLMDDLVGFNTGIIDDGSFVIYKFNGTASGDKITIQSKFKTPAEPMLIEGKLWANTKAYFVYETFGPSHPLAFEPMTMVCSKTTLDPVDGMITIKSWGMDNNTLKKYDLTQDTVRFFIALEFESVGPGTKATFLEYVDPFDSADQFLLRRDEYAKQVLDENGWSIAPGDCNVNA